MYLELSLTVEKTDYEKLISGENIAILFRPFPVGRKFILAPIINNENGENTEFLSNTFVEVVDKEIITQDKINIDLANVLNISLENLRKKLSKSENLHLMYFRVYLFEPQIQVITQTQTGFLPLPKSILTKDPVPLINDQLFLKRREQIKNRQTLNLSELEILQIAVNKLSLDNSKGKSLNEHIKAFLKIESSNQQIIPDWIKNQDIITLGENSKKLIAIHAGTKFEDVTKKALEFLGFTIDYSHKGGAGGLDLLCLKPYPLFGECKAGRSIPNNTAVQLLNLGMIRENHLFNASGTVRLIIGSGKPTSQLLDSAKANNMSIIHPTSLQKLVELHATYQGCIDLIELRKYLVSGQNETAIDNYIEKVVAEINLRSQVVQTVKNFLQNTSLESADINVLFGVYAGSNPIRKLKLEELKEILLELSSPLTGYLGRDKSDEGKGDRFYYLRDLPI